MRKNNAVLVILMVLLFTQCKPKDDIEFLENMNTQKSSLSGEIDLPNNRLLMSEDGDLSWDITEHFYFFSKYNVIPTMMKLIALSPNNPKIRTYMCEDVGIGRPDYISRELYYLGSTVPTMDVIEKRLLLQSGKLENIGDYLLGKLNIMATQNSDGNFTFPTTRLSLSVAVINIDFPEHDCYRYYINYKNCINEIEISIDKRSITEHPDDATKKIDVLTTKEEYFVGSIGVTESSKNSYVVLFPPERSMPNTVIDIFADNQKIGSIVLPNGIRANKLYVSEDGGPLQVNGRSKVVEKDLLDNLDDLI